MKTFGALLLLLVDVNFSAFRRQALALENGLARLPPMGWRSWNCYATAINEKRIESQIDALVVLRDASSGEPLTPKDSYGAGAPGVSLLSFGYASIGIDEGYEGCGMGVNGTVHTADGTPTVDPKRFPSMPKLVQYGHDRGVRMGFYLNGCGCHEHVERMINYEGDVRATVEWGFDSVKIDSCGAQKNSTLYASLFNRTGVPVEIEQCHQGQSIPDGGNPDQMYPGWCPYHSFRTSGDIYNLWDRVMSNLLTVVPFLQPAPHLTLSVDSAADASLDASASSSSATASRASSLPASSMSSSSSTTTAAATTAVTTTAATAASSPLPAFLFSPAAVAQSNGPLAHTPSSTATAATASPPTATAATAPRSRPGCWAYPDMLEVGRMVEHNAAESRSHFAAWALVSSPLILGFDLTNLTKLRSAWPVISNAEVIEMSQTWVETAAAPSGKLLKRWHDTNAPTLAVRGGCGGSDGGGAAGGGGGDGVGGDGVSSVSSAASSRSYCVDTHSECAAWAAQEACLSNPNFMETNCARSCGNCIQGNFTGWRYDAASQSLRIGDLCVDAAGQLPSGPAAVNEMHMHACEHGKPTQRVSFLDDGQIAVGLGNRLCLSATRSWLWSHPVVSLAKCAGTRTAGAESVPRIRSETARSSHPIRNTNPDASRNFEPEFGAKVGPISDPESTSKFSVKNSPEYRQEIDARMARQSAPDAAPPPSLTWRLFSNATLRNSQLGCVEVSSHSGPPSTIWSKPLTRSRLAVLAINGADIPHRMSLNLSEIVQLAQMRTSTQPTRTSAVSPDTGTWSVRDVWANASLGVFTQVTRIIGPHDCLLLVLTPLTADVSRVAERV